MATAKLTATGISASIKKARITGRDVWLSDDSSTRGDGRLQLRTRPGGGHRWYWRYTKSDGTSARIMLGTYTAERASGSLTLPQARADAARKAALYHVPESRDV